MTRIVLLVLGLVVLLHAVLWLFQDRLIYFPQRYRFGPEQLPAPFVALRFHAAAGPQTALYLPPRSGRLEHLWLAFGGNAMTALDWTDWATRHPDHDAGFLLVDYPGYGFNAGAPSRTAIVEASQAAFEALAAHLATAPEALAARTHLLGHSLGAAAALEFAKRRPPRGVVLTAPFTRLSDVAARFYGPLARALVRDDYDNAARLAELGGGGVLPPPTVILHGRDDEVIAFELGERLARGAPWARFVPIDGGRHNDLYLMAPDQIRAAMREVAARAVEAPRR